MRILCVSPSYWPALRYGGPISAVHGLNKALVNKGVDITVYTTNVGLGREVRVNQELNLDGVRVTYFEYLESLELFGTTGWQFCWRLNKALTTSLAAFDLIHIVAVWNYPTAVTASYCRRLRKPYIISPHGSLYPFTMKRKSWKKWPYYHLVAKRDLGGASAIHYLTSDEMQKCHPPLDLRNKAVVNPNGIDLADFSALPERGQLARRYPFLKNKKTILFFGRIHWIKGLDMLVKAYGRLAKERRDVHLLIVGPDEGGYGREVRKWIKEQGAEDSVTFTGMLKGEERLEVLASSDVFALPSYSETFSMAILEAMACRLPVVITKQCHFPEVEEIGAGKIVDVNADRLSEALIELLDNPRLCQRMGENGRGLVSEKFAWDKVAEKMVQVYQSLVTRSL